MNLNYLNHTFIKNEPYRKYHCVICGIAVYPGTYTDNIYCVAKSFELLNITCEEQQIKNLLE